MGEGALCPIHLTEATVGAQFIGASPIDRPVPLADQLHAYGCLLCH